MIAPFCALALLAAQAAVPRADGSSGRVDPRLELLGVVQFLAGHGEPETIEEGYRARIEERFGGWRSHPAVELYRLLASRLGPPEGFGIILLYYSDPPGLALKDPESRPPYIEEKEEPQRAQRLLWELRDLAARSGFMAFFQENRAFYGQVEASFLERLQGVDLLEAIQGYLGMGLESRCHYLLSPIYRPSRRNSFILPYPDPRSLTRVPARGFDVYTLVPVPRRDLQGLGRSPPPGYWWHEPLYVFIDLSVHAFEQANLRGAAALYGPELARCRERDANCVKGYLVAAMVERLSQRSYGSSLATESPGDPAYARTVRALSSRLGEYEKDRGSFPTLWSFYPRLFSVFPELAFPRERPPALSVPDPGGARKVTDLWAEP